MRPHFNLVFDLQINNSRDLFVLNFVINGKVISLPKVIRYVKRITGEGSFHNFSPKHTPCAPLNMDEVSKNNFCNFSIHCMNNIHVSAG